MHRPTPLLSAFVLPAAALFVVGCLGGESGIDNRHIQGFVTLPPVPLSEGEPTPRSAVTDENNDEAATADGPFSIGYGYHVIRGASDAPCPAIEAETLEDEPGTCGFSADKDVFRIRAAYKGPLVIKARMGPGQAGDVDISITDGTLNALYSDPNAVDVERDEAGEPVLDENGEERPIILPPRYSDADGVAAGDEFLVTVTVHSASDAPAYELVIVGEDPRQHLIQEGVEGDVAGIELPTEDRVIVDPFDIKVGAYLSGDLEQPGRPVAGTSCKRWGFDAPTETFWCAWDMVHSRALSIEGNVLIPEMRDSIDNDCDGKADSGTETNDDDGDGFTIARGDCNDTSVDVGPAIAYGDRNGDGIDNDCDGWADNGPDDVDDDGDGYCEGGRDLDADGICRGELEIQGLSGGDCNDRVAAIYPALDHEIPQNALDDDCSSGDSGLPTANTDGDAAGPSSTAHQWSDLEEEACGTDPFDSGDRPVDADEDGLCDSLCVGTAGCDQDWDGDGQHNWTELLCATDPDAASTAPDLDGDGTCDGMDSDADGDGIDRQIGQVGTDCNDLDDSIHPHRTDEAGIVTEYNYDVVDGIDADCDGEVDENRDWISEGGTFVEDPARAYADGDGDGYSIGNRDCNDTDASVHLGNWELRAETAVRTDYSLLFLFAGDVASLNNTAELPNGRRVAAMVPHDVEKQAVGWSLVADWALGEPSRLGVSAAPVLEAALSPQPKVGRIWYEALDATGAEIPNNVTISGFGPGEETPWAEGHYQELGDAAEAGRTNELYGSISSIVTDTWDGDNDAFHITFPEAGFINVSLTWATGGGDYDSQFICYYVDAANPGGYYNIPFEPGIADFTKPEEGTTIVPLPDGADCWFFVAGYSGSPGGYSLSITPRGN